MKTIYLFIICTFFFLSCNEKETTTNTENNTGTASANFNGVDWSGKWASALGANLGTQIMTLNFSTAEKDNSTGVSIGINNFTGTGIYKYGPDYNNLTFSVKYNNNDYSILDLIGGGGSGEINITKMTNSTSIITPGIIEGAFSGTIKNIASEEILTIKDGKFSALKF